VGALPPPEALGDEPAPRSSIADGADLVLFSGDKLLGGPQAGIIIGREDAVRTVRRHPLMRALRVDKMTYAALEATLQEHATDRAERTVPVARMIAMSVDEIGTRANALAARIDSASLSVDVVDGFSTIGGGSAPGSHLPTRLVALTHRSSSATDLESRLRASDPPVITRIADGLVVLDLRTVAADQDEPLVNLLRKL